jgi:hypothetical protein
MSIAGYFGRQGPARLRRGEPVGRGLGIDVKGPVLEGLKTPNERRAEEAARVGRDGEFYREVEHYDAVLRSHCWTQGTDNY